MKLQVDLQDLRYMIREKCDDIIADPSSRMNSSTGSVTSRKTSGSRKYARAGGYP